MIKIVVQDTEINVDEDYISLTDMVRSNTTEIGLIEKWISNKNTIEFIGAWEQLNNQNFNYPEFGVIKNEAGTNRFIMSVKQWVAKTNAIGLTAKTGRYGGTYAHKDIAFEFGTWLSPVFKLYLIKEFQRLKEDEQKRLSSGWDVRRLVSKANYKIQTDAIAENLIPNMHLPKDKEFIVYAEEADLVNYALFGMTAKQWRDKNPKLVAQGTNIRDYANVFQLIVISNLESLNGEMIHQGISKGDRFKTLQTVAASQLKSLSTSKAANILNADSPNKQLSPPKQTLSDFDKSLKGIMVAGKPPPFKDKESE